MSKPAKGIWGFKDNWDFARWLAILSIVLVVLALFCTGPPEQFEPVAKYVTLGSTFGLVATMPVDASVTSPVIAAGPASFLLVITTMTTPDRYMRTEIPMALPPARAVIELRAAAFLVSNSSYSRRGFDHPPRINSQALSLRL